MARLQRVPSIPEPAIHVGAPDCWFADRQATAPLCPLRSTTVWLNPGLPDTQRNAIAGLENFGGLCGATPAAPVVVTSPGSRIMNCKNIGNQERHAEITVWSSGLHALVVDIEPHIGFCSSGLHPKHQPRTERTKRWSLPLLQVPPRSSEKICSGSVADADAGDVIQHISRRHKDRYRRSSASSTSQSMVILAVS